MVNELIRPPDKVPHVRRIGVSTVMLPPRKLSAQQARFIHRGRVTLW